MESDKPVLSFIWKCKEKSKSNKVEKLTLPDIKIYYTAISLKRV